MKYPTLLPVLALAALLAGCSSTTIYYFEGSNAAPPVAQPPQHDEHAHVHSAEVASPYADIGEYEEGTILHLPTGKVVTEDELIDLLAVNRVIYVGEAHDSVDAHAVQLKIIQRVQERFPGQVAVGMEMLRVNYQEDVDKWLADELSDKEFLRVWVKSWSNTFDYYADILNFVKENKMPLLAMNSPKRMGHGAKAEEKKPEAAEAEKTAEAEKGDNKPESEDGKKTGEMKPVEVAQEMAKAKPEIELDESDPYYRAFIGAFLAGHDDDNPEMTEMFIKGQLRWDETMAQTGAEFLLRPENKDMKLIVLAGGNHVRYGFGIPRRLFRRLPAPYAIVEPHVNEYPEDKLDRLMTGLNLPELPLPMADFVWIVGYEDLEGEKVRLGVRIEESEEPAGIMVVKVSEGSSADKAGILDGDVIISIDGTETKELFDLTYELGKKKIGDMGTVEVIREGEKLALEVSFDIFDFNAALQKMHEVEAKEKP